ncbi:MAG: sensor histidine kinase [Bacteroidota bacterium]
MIYSKKIAALILTVFLVQDLATAQILPFRNYSIEFGLSESVAHDLIQDSKGYIWVGTGYGLNRFDGKRFRQYYEENGLANNRVHTLFEDSENKIWVGTENGITVIKEDSLHTPEYLSELSDTAVLSFFEDFLGTIWIGTADNGLWRLNSNNRLVHYSEENELGIIKANDLAQTEDGVIWVASDEGLFRLEDGKCDYFGDEEGLPEVRVQSVIVDRYNRLWIASREGLVLYRDGEFQLFNQQHGLDNNRVLTITVQAYDKIWVGTENGLALFDGQSFTNYSRENGLPATTIYSSIIDREGNLWLGTLGGGITHYSGELFQSYNIDTGLPNNVVNGFTEDRYGNIWIATYGGGVVRYDGENLRVFDETDGLQDNKVYTFLEDSRNQFWIGTREGISIYDKGRFTDFEAFDINFQSVRSIYEDTNKNEFWIATYNDGVYRLRTDGYDHYNTSNVLPNNTVMDIKQDEEGIIWLATYGGVVKYLDGEFETITIADGLPSNGVIEIFIDHLGEKWFSTFNGPARYRDGDVERLIRSNQVETIFYFTVQDRENRYWIGTNRGLYLFRKDEFYDSETELERMLSYRTYTDSQGLIANELNAGGSLLASDGTIWLGTVEGMSRFFPDRIDNNSTAPGLEFESLSISGREVEPGREYRFTHDYNFLQATVTGLTFEAPDQIIYQHRLKGLNDEWTITRENEIRYPGLPPDDYSLQVRAYNADGAQSEEISEFNFTVLPPFYFQWWFILLATALFSGLILFIIHYYRVSKQVEIEKMRVQIASDLHDDVGSSLTELALQTDFLQAGEISKEMRDTLSQLGEQSRKIVTSLDDIVWSIDARNDTAGDLTDRMQDYVNQVFGNNQCEVIYHFDDLKMDEKLPVQAKENIYLIFKEAVNNIIKHSDATRAQIRFSFDGNNFKLNVEDNGRTANKVKKSGQGLRNMQLRADRIGADLSIKNGQGFSITASGRVS